MEIAVPAELMDLYELVLNPERVLVGSRFSQRWEVDGSRVWFLADVVSCKMTERGLLDFEVVFDDGRTCYLAPEEMIIDIIRGDLAAWAVQLK